MIEPFALSLYRRYTAGETVEQLAVELGIPDERIERRIRAAARYAEHEKTGAGLRQLASRLQETVAE
jgi:hypothetical protein